MTTALPFMDELRSLPADRLEEEADFIHTLLEERRLRRESMIDATAGSLVGEEGEALEFLLDEAFQHPGKRVLVSELRRKQA